MSGCVCVCVRVYVYVYVWCVCVCVRARVVGGQGRRGFESSRLLNLGFVFLTEPSRPCMKRAQGKLRALGPVLEGPGSNSLIGQP